MMNNCFLEFGFIAKNKNTILYYRNSAKILNNNKSIDYFIKTSKKWIHITPASENLYTNQTINIREINDIASQNNSNSNSLKIQQENSELIESNKILNSKLNGENETSLINIGANNITTSFENIDENSTSIHYTFREEFISFLLRNSISSMTSLSNTEKVRVFKSFFTEFPHHKYPTYNQRQELSKQIALDFNEMNACIISAREKDRMNYLEINPSIKTFIREWMNSMNVDMNNRAPSQEEWKYLESETGISRNSLVKLIKIISISNKQGIVTNESKDIIIKWLEENEYRKPTIQERDELLKQTGWSKEQLIHQIQYYRDPSGEITHESKSIISRWIEKHKRIPTKEERDILQEQTCLSRWQLQFQIESFLSQKKQITPEDRQFVSKWLKDNHTNQPSQEQRLFLLKETKLTSKQLSKLIRYIQDIRGEVSPEAKEIIQMWLMENNMRKPNMKEKIEIQKRTRLGIQQIESLCRKFLEQRPGELSKINKEIILSWESSNPLERISLTELSKKTGLNRTQIHSQLQLIRKKKKLGKF